MAIGIKASVSNSVIKYNVCLRTLLQYDISEPVLYDDLLYKLREIVGKSNFVE